MNDAQLSHELEIAARQALEARARVVELPPQSAVIEYLEATVMHLSIVSVAQARQHEWLVAEVEDRREALETRQRALH